MTPAELIAFATSRHGKHWYTPLAEETGYSVSHLWRIANEGRPLNRRLKLIINGLPKKEAEQQGRESNA